MERLTQRTKEGIWVKEDYGENASKTLCQCYGVEPMLHYANCDEEYCATEKLAKYEDLTEQGGLLELPCVVGDTVWTNASMHGWYFREKDKPYKATVVFVGINGTENFMYVDFGNGHMLQFNFSDIGKRAFLTETEAKKALEGKAE